MPYFWFLTQSSTIILFNIFFFEKKSILRWSKDLLLKWSWEILECIVELCVREARMLPRGECIGSRHGVALFTFTHLSEDFNGWNCSKRAEYVTDISLSPEFRAYIFSRNYSCIRERYAIIKLNGRERRVSAKSVDAISRKKKKNRINANWILQSTFPERMYFIFFFFFLFKE